MRLMKSSSTRMELGATLLFFSHGHVPQRAPKSWVAICHGSNKRPLYWKPWSSSFALRDKSGQYKNKKEAPKANCKYAQSEHA